MTHRLSPRAVARTLIALVSGLVLACGGGEDGTVTGATLGGAVATITLSAPSVSLEVGGSTTLQAQALDADGRPVARQIVWSSSDTSIVRVGTDGRVSGVAVGRAEVAANSDGKFTKAAVTVGPRAVATVQLTPAAPRLSVGARTTLAARTLAADGSELTGRVVTWGTTDPRIVTVDSAGTIEGRAPGVATVTATSGERVASVGVTVVAVPIARLDVSPAADTIVVGQSAQLTATARDSAGRVLAERVVAWSTGDAAVVSVSSSGLVLAAAPGTATVTATAEGQTATARVVVRARPAASVIVSPTGARLQVGDTVRLSGQVTDAAGAVLADRPITFASSDAAVARVSAAGLVTAAGAGTATITATSGAASGTVTVVVTAADVATIDLLPASASLTVGDTLRLRATARNGAGAVLTGRPITWTTGAPGVASVSADGLLAATGAGTAVILASSGRASATMTVTVRAVPAAAVRVVPSSLVMLVGDVRDLAATVLDAGNAPLPYPVTFTSSDETVAAVSSAGRVVARALGTAQITATSGGVRGTATVVVTPDPVVAVTIAGVPGSLVPGATAPLSAVATDRSGNAVAGRVATWRTADPAVASVSATGVLTAVGPGTTQVAATVDGVTGSATVSVATTPAARVAVSLGTASLPVGQTTQATAAVFDAANNPLAGRAVAWTSSNGAVASVSGSGVVTAVGVGSATITATSGGVSGGASIAVTAVVPPPPPPPAAVASVTVTLGASSLTVGGTTAATATLRDAAGNVLTGRTVTWSSSNGAAASVSATGAVTAVGAGNANIVATSEGVSGSASLSVAATPPPPPAAVASITVSVGTATLTAGQTTAASATLRDAAGNVLTGRTITWTSSNGAAASVSASGQVTAVAPGSANIVATSGGVSGSASVSVVAPPPAPVATVSVALGASTLSVGGTTSAVATLRDAAGNVLTGRTVTWASSNGAAASVSASGVVTAVGAGSANITATSGTASGSASVTVTAPPPAAVASVTVALGSSTLTSGGTTTATATLRDAQGNVLTGRPVAWTSSNGAAASVNGSGVVTAVGAGSANIVATSGTVSGSASVTVQAPGPVVARVSVVPGTLNLRLDRNRDDSGTLVAFAFDARGLPIPNATFTWTIDDPRVASVSAGLGNPLATVTALATGETTVRVRSGNATDAVNVRVR